MPGPALGRTVSPVPDPDHRAGLFPALLKHWRRQRGLSQLDLAVAADVSARHISFLETGRSAPSPEMVVQLGSTLGVPLRQVDAMLRAAGHDPVYGDADGELPPAVTDAVRLLKEHHEPFPLIIVDRTYQVLDANRGALALLSAVLGGPPPIAPMTPEEVAALGVNLARLTFAMADTNAQLVNFDDVGRQLLWRIQREVLADPDDGELRDLLDELLAMPSVADDWRRVDLSVPAEPAMVLHLRGDIGGSTADLRFLTAVTAFQAPQNVAVERLWVETWLPYDDATAAVCAALAAG